MPYICRQTAAKKGDKLAAGLRRTKLELSEILRLSKDRDVSPDFTAKLMARLLEHERRNVTTHLMLGMRIGWATGAGLASQNSVLAKARGLYTYSDYINRGKAQRVVCYDASRSEYIDLSQPPEN